MSETTDARSGGEVFAVAAFDDPHLLPAAKHPARAEAVAGLFMFVGILGFAAYGAFYWVNWSTQWLGASLGVGLFCFGFGLSAWGKYLLPQGPFEEERHPSGSTPDEVEAMTAAVTSRSRIMFRRRGALGVLLGAGSGIMGIVLGFPLLRSLGPVPKSIFEHTHWKTGSHVVNSNGRWVKDGDVLSGGSLTVFPEGYVGNAMDQAILIHPYEGTQDVVTAPGRETWAPRGNLVFSKVCTHAGCPVGLYQEQTLQLLCPCHQSLFDVGDGRPAKPVFGPAPRPLPQLPIMIDGNGYLLAQSGFHEAVGPAFWERTT